jgi:hypothetical protein
MHKILIAFLLFSMLVFGNEKFNQHLEELNAAYPYGLLTDDFGILNMDDLKINTCMARPQPLSDDSMAYAYWQCFEVKKSKMECEGNNYDPDQKARVSLQVISSVRGGELHEFIARRLWPLESCQSHVEDWRYLTKDQEHICISGEPILNDIKNGQVRWVWDYGRYKTKKGCDSYFAEECNVIHVCRNTH